MQGIPALVPTSAGADTYRVSTASRTVEKYSQENLLKLTQSLQTTLDIDRLLLMFSNELSRLVPHDGLSFTCTEGIKHQAGREADKHYVMTLKVPGKSEIIGVLRFDRDPTPFNLLELENIHRLSSNLAYPIRNALMYEKALLNAAKDPLTGVNNRSMMESTIQREIDLARRHGTPLTLLCADVDFFKRVNDRFGHSAGDKILRSVANSISRCIRSSDVIFRYGGEEFVILLPNTDASGSQLLAERIRTSIANSENRHLDYHINVTISIGVHTLSIEDSPGNLFNKADQALYQAKRSGRNRVCIL
ncbi:MAG: GGDEF domain-containing protein [Gammaproteobacteria bacterium]|nr:GGDEF domain-containing protein [Gammaproteobacteria bacterium]